MAGFRETDTSPLADALILIALFVPFIPIVAICYTGAATALAGCPDNIAKACSFAGIDLNALHGSTTALLKWSAGIGASGGLLTYICLLALLAQFTTKGLRGRVVRTCAVIMWAGVMPLILAAADAIALTPERLCAGGACTPETVLPALAKLAHIFAAWLTQTAVPLGVFMAMLVALSMGYRMLVSWFVQLLGKLH